MRESYYSVPSDPETMVKRIKGWITSQCFSYDQLLEITMTADTAVDRLDDLSIIQEEEEDQKENTMYMQATIQDEAQKTNYLRDRLREVWSDKYTELKIQYGLQDDASPQSGTETIQRIKDGRYKIEPNRYGGTDHIRWRDPSKKEDWEGFAIACEKLTKMQATAKDDIMVQDAGTALATLRSFRDAPVQ